MNGDKKSEWGLVLAMALCVVFWALVALSLF